MGVDHLTMLDVQHLQIWRPSPMRRDSTRSAFACQLDPDEESWLANAGSPRFEETVCEARAIPMSGCSACRLSVSTST